MTEREYAYYTGCSLEGTASEYDTSLRLVLKTLGISLREPEDWSCCGSSPAHTVNHVFAAALAARNLAIVEKAGFETLITPCPSCMMVFKKAQHEMTKSESFKQEVNELLDEPYECGVIAKSALQVIYEDVGLDAVAEKVTHALPELKVAPYYGCILNRPPDVAKFDNPENPVSMDKILKAVGVEVCDFAFKVECCGAAFGVPKRKMVNQLTYKVLLMAQDCGANCIAVACPLCQQNLDLRQDQVNRVMGSSFNIPIIYFSQIMGLAYGYLPRELAMDKLIVSADHLIRSRITIQEAKKIEEERAKGKKKKVEVKETTEEIISEENQ